MDTDYRILDCCDLCGSESENFDVLVSEVPCKESTLYELGITSLYETVMCRACGWIFKPGILTAEQLEVLYGKYGGGSTLNDNCEKASHIRSSQLYFWIRKHVSIKKNCSILDVGGGVGQATSMFADKGYNVTVLDMAGGELVRNNMKLLKSTYYEYSPSQNYDLIFMNHVSEHVWDPTKLFLHSHKHLSDTGILYVEVPFELITPLIKAKLGDPCHVGYFTLHTLKAFFKKCGFKVIKLERDLGWYNERRVMILRGIAEKNCVNTIECEKLELVSLNVHENISRIEMMEEIFNISQIYIIWQLMFHMALRRIFR